MLKSLPTDKICTYRSMNKQYVVNKVKLSPFSQERPEGSLFNSYYTEM